MPIQKVSIAALCALLVASIAGAAPPDESCTPELRRPPAIINGVQAVEPVPKLLVARIGADGKLVIACVTGEDAAKRFFETPAEKLPQARKEK